MKPRPRGELLLFPGLANPEVGPPVPPPPVRLSASGIPKSIPGDVDGALNHLAVAGECDDCFGVVTAWIDGWATPGVDKDLMLEELVDAVRRSLRRTGPRSRGAPSGTRATPPPARPAPARPAPPSAATRSVGACDDEVHLLCPACVDARRCPRCERGTPLAPGTRLQVDGAEEVVRVAGPACGDGLDLRSAPVAARSAPVASAPGAPAPRPAPAPGPATVAPSRRVAGGSVAALEALLRAAGGPMATAELQAATGLGAATLRAALAPLIASGQVERAGQTRATRYAWRGP